MLCRWSKVHKLAPNCRSNLSPKRPKNRNDSELQLTDQPACSEGNLEYVSHVHVVVTHDSQLRAMYLSATRQKVTMPSGDLTNTPSENTLCRWTFRFNGWLNKRHLLFMSYGQIKTVRWFRNNVFQEAGTAPGFLNNKIRIQYGILFALCVNAVIHKAIISHKFNKT